MAIFKAHAQESFLCRVVAQLRAGLPDGLIADDSAVRASALGWIEDARRWGFNSEPDILRYVNSRADTQGRREPVKARLPVYLKLYHERLINGVDLQTFVPLVMKMASEQNVREEEGIAWLAVLLLSGIQKGDTDFRWVVNELNSSNDKEETRLHQIHQGAAERGWFTNTPWAAR